MAPLPIEVDLKGDVNTVRVSGTAQTARDIGASVLLSSGTGAGQISLSSGLVTLAGVTHTGAVIPTVTTVTNQLTAAQIATGVWQDATAGDFTVASSIGKSLYTGNVAPGGSGGLFIAGINAATTITTAFTTTFTGDLTGNVLGGVGSVASGGIKAASFEAGAINAAAIATGAIDADALAADAVTEIQTGLSTLDAAGVRTAVGLASANLDTQLTAIDDYLDTEVAAIKAKTDQLTFTVANQVDANALSGVPTVGAVADQVWDEALAGHLGAGSTGAALNAAGAAGDPWSTAIPGAYGAGTAGYILGTNIDATISSRGTSTLTQTQVTGGAYALNSASFSFNTGLDFTTTQKAATLARVTLTDTATTVTNRVTANSDQIAGVAAAATRLSLSAGQIIPGTVATAGFTPTTTEFEASDITEATTDHYNGRVVIWTGGALTGQATSISNYTLTGGRGHFTVVAMTEAPANTDTFVIV